MRKWLANRLCDLAGRIDSERVVISVFGGPVEITIELGFASDHVPDAPAPIDVSWRKMHGGDAE